METVQSLRSQGYQVRVTHYRDYNLFSVVSEDAIVTPEMLKPLTGVARHELPKEMHRHVLPTGGATVVEVTAPDGKFYRDTAICADHDSFCKKRGVKIALGRIVNKMKG